MEYMPRAKAIAETLNGSLTRVTGQTVKISNRKIKFFKYFNEFNSGQLLALTTNCIKYVMARTCCYRM